MKFARIVFGVAGIYGILATLPLYFIYDYISRRDPPPITHPQFYFGFAGVTLAWQFAFLVIAAYPTRYRAMMIPSIIEKLSYVLACAALFWSGRIPVPQAATALPDLTLALLFIAGFMKTRPAVGTV
jgi:hypothetical protein